MGHFYVKEGDVVKPMFTVATAKGGSRNTNVGDIKRMKKKGIDLLPSVTTIQGQLSKGDGLEHWKINEHLSQAEKLMYQNSDNLEKLLEWSSNPGSFQREVKELTEPELSKYSEAGTEAHAIFEDYVAELMIGIGNFHPPKREYDLAETATSVTSGPMDRPMNRKHPSWCHKAWDRLIEECLNHITEFSHDEVKLTGVWCETLLASSPARSMCAIGYAGTVDLILTFEDEGCNVHRFVVDLKTKLNGLGRSMQTEEHRVQLMAYGELVSLWHKDSGTPEPCNNYHANLYVSLNGDDEVEVKILTPKQEEKAYNIWEALVALWGAAHPDE